MGERPKGLTLDRIDNSKDYGPGNCRWATRKEQQLNRRNNRIFTLGEKTISISEWATHSGIKLTTIYDRLARGWTPAKALTLPATR